MAISAEEINAGPFGAPAVGDLQSDAKGSGARFNAGKPRVDLLLWSDLHDIMRPRATEAHPEVGSMYWLGQYQKTQDPVHLMSLLSTLYTTNITVAFTEAAQVFEYGAKKYAAWNWCKGMAWSVPVGCMGRHILALLLGESNDQESGLPHRGHIACNVFMLLHYHKHYPEGNDLPPPELFS